MSITADYLRQLVEAELSKVSDPQVVSQIHLFLLQPRIIERNWDYGEPGQTYPCWSLLDHPASNTGIVYCQKGFGPRRPWGLVGLVNTEDSSMGMDSGWFDSFMAAYFESWLFGELPIWKVFRVVDPPGQNVPLTEESDLDSAWTRAEELRATESCAEYRVLNARGLGISGFQH